MSKRLEAQSAHEDIEVGHGIDAHGREKARSSMRIGPLGAARLLGVLAGGVLISAPLCGFISDDGEAWPSLLRNDLQSSDRSPSRSTGRSGGEFRRVYVTTNTDYESRSAVIEAKLTDLVRTSVITGESESDE